MANEATVRTGLQMNLNASASQKYNSQSTFQVNATTPNGPTPGLLTVTTTGRTVTLSELTQPGLYKITNLDPTNYVEFGPYVSGLGFVFWNKIPPGHSYIGYFSENLGEVDEGVGTGTTARVPTIHLRAHVATCEVLLEVFEA